MNSTSPDLSILIVSYNAPDLLGRTLQSVREHPPPRPWEIIVVDNASTEGNAALVRDHFPEVRLLEAGVNLGFAAANNRGMEMAQGRYLLLLNPDTEVREGALDQLCRVLDTHPEVGAAGALLLLPTGEPQPLDLSFPSAWATLLDFSWLWRARPRKRPEPGPGGLIERDYLSGACLMTRREVVAQIGGLDEGYFLFFEDTDWCWRMHQGGWRVVEVPAAQVVHHVGRAGATSDLIRRGWNYYGLHRFFRLHRRREAHWALSRGLRVLCGAKLSLLWILERAGRVSPPEAAARRAFLRRVLEVTRQAV